MPLASFRLPCRIWPQLRGPIVVHYADSCSIYIPALLSRGSPHYELNIIINDVPGLIYVNKAKTVVHC